MIIHTCLTRGLPYVSKYPNIVRYNGVLRTEGGKHISES